MSFILRALGLEGLAWLGRRLPGPWPRIVSVALTVVANLLPIFAVWRGWLGLGDVFLLYWLENVIVWITATIRILTADPEGTTPSRRAGLAGFFALHYGLFTVVHGVFTGVLVAFTGGLAGGWRSLALPLVFLVLSHFVRLAFFWFARGERMAANPGGAMLAPYPRMLVMHVAIIGSSFLLLSSIGTFEVETNALRAVALLCSLKLVVDLVMTWVGDRLLRGGGEIKLEFTRF